MILKLLALMAIVVMPSLSAAKVLIFTYSYNRPDFIEIQYKTFKKFLKDDYEYIVFNDASNEKDRLNIEKMCASLNIQCLNIPQEIHAQPYLQRFRGENWNHPSVRNCNVVQYSLNTLGFMHNGIVALFDSDLFLVKDFSISKFLQGYHLSAYETHRSEKGKTINYLWIGLVFLNMASMPNPKSINFNCGQINGVGVDSGGFTHYYLKANPTAKVRNMDRKIAPFQFCVHCKRKKNTNCIHNTKALRSEGFDKNQISLIHTGVDGLQFLQETCFLHYSAGSNWNNKSQDFHRLKTKLLNDYINSILKDN